MQNFQSVKDLKGAIVDLRYLLNRGYSRKVALDFVCNRYGFSAAERNFLVRSVFSKAEILEHRKKRARISEVKGREVAVDGYNVLITAEAGLRGEEVFLCDDGFVRDVQASFGKYRASDATLPAMDAILRRLRRHSPRRVIFIFDSQVSRSGELAAEVRERLRFLGVEGDASVATDADRALVRYRYVCSSDRAVIKKAERIIDLPFYVLKKSLGRLPK